MLFASNHFKQKYCPNFSTDYIVRNIMHSKKIVNDADVNGEFPVKLCPDCRRVYKTFKGTEANATLRAHYITPLAFQRLGWCAKNVWCAP